MGLRLSSNSTQKITGSFWKSEFVLWQNSFSLLRGTELEDKVKCYDRFGGF